MLEYTLLVQVGIYTVKLKVKVGNYSPNLQVITKGQFLGYIHDCETLPAVSTLSQKAAKRLTEEELQERRDFIVTSLKLDENKLLQQNPKIKSKGQPESLTLEPQTRAKFEDPTR